MRTPEKLASGKYKVRFRHLGKQTSETFNQRTRAVWFAKLVDAIGPDRALQELYSNTAAKPGVPAMDQVAADHIKFLTGIEDGTRIRYQRLWARTWSPLIGSIPANLLTKDDVAQAVNDLGGRYSEKSLKNQRGLLSSVCDRAIDQGHLAANPARGVRLPRGNAIGDDDEPDMVLIDRDEWPILYDAMTPHYRPFTRFLVGTGARWGEVVVLRRRDFTLPKVRITRALKDSPDGVRRIGVTKTKKSKRTVILGPTLIADVEPLLEGLKPDDIVFTAPRGGMIKHSTFWEDHWRPTLHRAQHCAVHTPPGCKCGTAHPKRCTLHRGQVPAPCGCAGTLTTTPRIHDLRHTYVSWQLDDGVPIHVVQANLGHESIQTTVDRYSHLLPDAQASAAAAADRVFKPR